jgi:hypothetical protein
MATLLIKVDQDALVSVDGEAPQRIAQDQTIKVQVGIGQHIIEARSPSTNARWEQTVQVKSAEQLVVKTELGSAQARADSALEAQRAREAASAASARQQRIAEAEKSLLGHWTHSGTIPAGANSADCWVNSHTQERRLLFTGERVPQTATGYLENLRGTLKASYGYSAAWSIRPGLTRDHSRECGGTYSQEIKITYYFVFEEALGTFRGEYSSARSDCSGECSGYEAASANFTAIVSGNQLTIRFSNGTVRTYTKSGI